MTKQQWHKFTALSHKWVGLILGLQLLAWTVGGLVMTWLPIEEVRGEHKVTPQDVLVLPLDKPFMSLGAMAALSDLQVSEVKHTHILDRPVVFLTGKSKRQELRDAYTGELLSPISKDMAQKIAERDYSLSASVTSVVELHEPSIDYKGRFPVWQVNFADEDDTSLYVSQTQARVVARRSDMWRLFDFFWMLHIMDYDERSNINNPLVITTSLFAALFAISGLSLLFFRFYRRDFNFVFGRKKAKKA